VSTKEFGCFFCSGKAVTPDGNCDTCAKSVNVGSWFIGKTI